MGISIRMIAVAMFMGALLSGCSDGSSPQSSTDGGGTASFKLIDPPVTGLDQSGDASGTGFVIVANRQGESSNVSAYQVLLQSSYAEGTQQMATFETTNGIKVGFAYSGTPVFTGDGRVAWVLMAGYTGAPTTFVARKINDMLPLLDESTWGIFPPSSTAKALPLLPGAEMKLPWCARGLSSKFATDYSGSVQNNILFASPLPRISSKTVANSMSGPLLPGSTIAIKLVEGDTVNIYATGTLSYTKDGIRWLAFGHALDQVGFTNLPVSKVYTNSTIDTGAWGIFKDSYPVGQTIGALVYDSYKGVVIDTNKVPEMTPVTVKVTMNAQSMTWSHSVARDSGSWLELYGLTAAVYGSLFTMNDINGNFSYSGTVTTTIEGQDPVVTQIDSNESTTTVLFSNYSTHSFVESLYPLYRKVSDIINSKTKVGKSFNSVKIEVNVTRN